MSKPHREMSDRRPKRISVRFGTFSIGTSAGNKIDVNWRDEQNDKQGADA